MEDRTYTSKIPLDTEFVNSYAELKKNLDAESSNFSYIVEHMPPAYSNTDAYIKNYVKKLNNDELKARADKLIELQNLKENNGLLEYMSEKNRGDFSHFRSQWHPLMWQAHEKENTKTVKIGEKIVNAGDLDFSIAESLELADSSRDPVTEYYDWIKVQDSIENNIYSQGTTIEEIDARNLFIDFMEHRETEIKRIADLYSASALNVNSPVQTLAQEKLKFTLFKLSELRRLRDKMKSTKSVPDKCKHQLEHEERMKKAQAEQENEYYENESGLLSFGENRLMNMNNENICCNVTNFRPHTQNKYDVKNKIQIATNNGINMAKMLQAMRNGLTREEWISQNTENNKQSNIKSLTLRGFDIASYNRALHELCKD
jgi:hypothetical protein